MRRIVEYIEAKKADLAAHPFLRALEENPPLERVVRFVPKVSFFVLAFQDLMRMTGERADGPRLRALLQQHCREEVGHEKWFFRDVARLSGALPDVAEVFGPGHALTRDAVYALGAEVVSARDDVERLCLIFTLEAAGEVCFGGAGAYFARVGVAGDLTYFAGIHRETEAAHSLFDQEMSGIVSGIELDEDSRARAVRAVDRIYRAMGVMLDGLATTLERAEAS